MMTENNASPTPSRRDEETPGTNALRGTAALAIRAERDEIRLRNAVASQMRQKMIADGQNRPSNTPI